MSEQARRVRRVMKGMFGSHPWYTSLALRLPIVENPKTKTVSTDGTALRFNPEWIDESTADDIRAAMAGCIVGCVLKHHTRRGDRHPGKWHAAHREVVKPILRADGLTDESGGIDMSIERAYELMPEPDDEEDDAPGDGGSGSGSSGSGSDQPSYGEMDDHPGETDSETRDHEQSWDEASHIASQTSKSAGRTPGTAAYALEAGYGGRVDYLTLLRRFMDSNAKTDWTWTRPNRRHIASGLYLPDLHSEAMGPIVMAIDTSGSVDERELADVWAEVRDAADQLRPESVTVVQCDHAVQEVTVYDCDDLPERIEVKGRGGTAFSPVFEIISEIGLVPACVIYYTDLYCMEFGDAPDYPVCWLASGIGGNEVPFGEVIRI